MNQPLTPPLSPTTKLIAHMFVMGATIFALMALTGGIPLFGAQMAATSTASGAIATTLMSNVPSALLLGMTAVSTFLCVHSVSNAQRAIASRQTEISKAEARGETPHLEANPYLDPKNQPHQFTIKAAQFVGACALVAGGLLAVNFVGTAAVGTAIAADIIKGAALLVVGSAAWHAGKCAEQLPAYIHAAQASEQQRIASIKAKTQEKAKEKESQPAPQTKNNHAQKILDERAKATHNNLHPQHTH